MVRGKTNAGVIACKVYAAAIVPAACVQVNPPAE
jgi:hypothetical protein